MEERHAYQPRDLEDRTDRDAQVALLDFAERGRRDPGATGKFLLCSAALPPGSLDLSA
jgi:hypothetical protein